MSKTKIEWTDESWNPVTGCSPVSPGCDNCYARRMAQRLQAMGIPKYKNGFKVTLRPGELEKPSHWKKPRRVFVCSMSDLFHPDVPYWFIDSVYECILYFNKHQFQILTKRSDRLRDYHNYRFFRNMPPHIWAGATVENVDYKFRIDDIRNTDAKTKFISFEPLLGDIGKLKLAGIDWVIIGCESGPGRRPMSLDWARRIVEDARNQGVAVFVKQLDINGRVSKKMAEWPLDLQIQEWPVHRDPHIRSDPKGRILERTEMRTLRNDPA